MFGIRLRTKRLSSLNLNLVVIKVRPIVRSSFKGRSTSSRYSVQRGVAEVRRYNVSVCVIKRDDQFDVFRWSRSRILYLTSYMKPLAILVTFMAEYHKVLPRETALSTFNLYFVGGHPRPFVCSCFKG